MLSSTIYSRAVFFTPGPGKGQRLRQRPEPRPKPKPRTELSILKKHINDIKIMNLSAKQLNDLEISLLDKGLKFTPTPPTGNAEKLTEDLKEFNRKLRLIEYFEGTDESDKSLVRNKSNFVPHPERNAALDKFVSTIESLPRTKIHNNIKQNLSKSEYSTIKSLQNDESIIIKEADKGGTTIIMDKEHYREMVKVIINDKDYYEQEAHGPHRSPELTAVNMYM